MHNIRATSALTMTTSSPTYLLLALRGLEFLVEREIRAKLQVLTALVLRAELSAQ